MYARDTILTLKEQREPEVEKLPDGTEREIPFPYNRVRVIGPSPITHSGPGVNAEWAGGQAQGVILEALTDFAGNLDEPFGKVQALYDVESEPVEEYEVQPKIRVINSATRAAGETPEEVFATKAPGVAPEPGQIRGRTSESPLEDPRPVVNEGPLGPAPKPKR